MWAVQLQSVRLVGPTGLTDQSDRPVGPTIVPCKRPVTLNLANKFSQCTFSVGEHYDLFSDLIIVVKRHGVDRMTSYCTATAAQCTDRTELTEKLLQEKLNATTAT